MARDATELPSYIVGFPVACNFALIILLIAGYTSHNLYRSTWFMLASLSGALHILMVARQASAVPQEKVLEGIGTHPADAPA